MMAKTRGHVANRAILQLLLFSPAINYQKKGSAVCVHVCIKKKKKKQEKKKEKKSASEMKCEATIIVSAE
jgi:hypothetical protein